MNVYSIDAKGLRESDFFKRVITFLATLLSIIMLGGCEKRPVGELHKVHWDRDMCERCKMVVSDRKHTVQVIDPKNGRSYMFDDIGCLVLWGQEEQIDWMGNAIVWITDVNSGEWIDAREAYYDTINLTPMAYGISAHKERSTIKAGEEVLRYEEIFPRIVEIEAQFNKKSH